MKRFFISFGIVAALLISISGYGQTGENRLGPPISMSIAPPIISGEYVKIPYSIPYDGYIIFDLYSLEGEKLWNATCVRLKGNYVQSVKRTPLKPGTQYNFDFWYKGKKYSGKFTNA
jgi:hypothetical protein